MSTHRKTITMRWAEGNRLRGEDGERAQRLGDKALAGAHLRFEDGDALPLVEQLRLALDRAFADRRHVDHLHFDGCTGLVFAEPGVEGAAHARVGHRVEDTPVDDAVGVHVVFRDGDARAAVAVATLVDVETDDSLEAHGGPGFTCHGRASYRPPPAPRSHFSGVNFTGMCLMPLMKFERRRSGGPASSMSG